MNRDKETPNPGRDTLKARTVNYFETPVTSPNFYKADNTRHRTYPPGEVPWGSSPVGPDVAPEMPQCWSWQQGADGLRYQNQLPQVFAMCFLFSSHCKGPAWLRAPALTQHHHQLHKWAPVQQLLFNTPGSHRAPLQDVVQCSQGQCDKGTQTLMARAIEANKASSP